MVRRPVLSPRLDGLGTTIFAEMSALAAATGAINLGQGFPDTDGPVEVADAADRRHPGRAQPVPARPGHPGAARGDRRAPGSGSGASTVDPDTRGAGDRRRHRGHRGRGARAVRSRATRSSPSSRSTTPTARSRRWPARRAPARHARPPDHAADVERAARRSSPTAPGSCCSTPRTTPPGKVFTADELAAIARLCVEHDLIAVTDEVYEHLVFDGAHVPLATFPGMAERTLTISSAGKTFSFTGWKIGWVCGPEELVAAVRTAKQFLTYVNGAPFQPAVAVGLGLRRRASTRRSATRSAAKRDLLCDGLRAAGFDVFVPARHLLRHRRHPAPRRRGRRSTFCRVAARSLRGGRGARVGVLRRPGRGAHLVRFAFCKRDGGADRGGRAPGRAQLSRGGKSTSAPMGRKPPAASTARSDERCGRDLHEHGPPSGTSRNDDRTSPRPSPRPRAATRHLEGHLPAAAQPAAHDRDCVRRAARRRSESVRYEWARASAGGRGRRRPFEREDDVPRSPPPAKTASRSSHGRSSRSARSPRKAGWRGALRSPAGGRSWTHPGSTSAATTW